MQSLVFQCKGRGKDYADDAFFHSGIVQTAMIEHIHEDLAISPESSPQVIKREAKPEEIAAMIAYLLGEESKFTTGTSMMIDGGWTS
jgi:NAD(P)-dependent dehydrogenase (short-subunit alcohol dehydrogenase family)